MKLNSDSSQHPERGDQLGLISDLARLGMRDDDLSDIASRIQATPAGRTTAPAGRPIKVYLAEEQPVLRTAYQTFLEAEDGIELLGSSEGPHAGPVFELGPDVMIVGVKALGEDTVGALNTLSTGLSGPGAGRALRLLRAVGSKRIEGFLERHLRRRLSPEAHRGHGGTARPNSPCRGRRPLHYGPGRDGGSGRSRPWAQRRWSGAAFCRRAGAPEPGRKDYRGETIANAHHSRHGTGSECSQCHSEPAGEESKTLGRLAWLSRPVIEPFRFFIPTRRDSE